MAAMETAEASVSICSGRDSSKAATEALQISALSASKHLIASGESGKEYYLKWVECVSNSLESKWNSMRRGQELASRNMN